MAAATDYGYSSQDMNEDGVEDDTPPDDPLAILKTETDESADESGIDRMKDYDHFRSPLRDLDTSSMLDDDDSDSDDDDISMDESYIYGAAGLPAIANRRGRSLIAIGWLVYVIFVAALAGALALFKGPLVDTWPPIGQFYDLFGAGPPTADAAFGVEIDPNPVWEPNGNGWNMAISGVVTNRADRALALPRLVISLVDQRNARVREADAGLAQRRLSPGDTAAFTVTIEDAPQQARGIDYRWEIQGER